MGTQVNPGKATLNQWHDDPSNWKLGMFYFNKKDKRIFPPKRIKYLGWTVNFTNPYSIIAVVILCIVIGFIVGWGFRFFDF